MINASVERRTSLQHLITALNLPTLDSSQRFFIGISGFPGGGKSTLAKELHDALIAKGYHVPLVNQDDFRVAKNERFRKNGSLAYAPLPLINQWHHWKDLETLLIELHRAKAGTPVTMVAYDSKTEDRTLQKTFELRGSGDVIIVEGAFIMFARIPRDLSRG